MRSPKAQKEDPNLVAAREREQRRAENARTEETQALLLGATQRRLRRFGRLGGSVPIFNAARPAGGPRTGGTGSGGGQVAAGGSSGRGVDGPGFGGGASFDGVTLY